MTSPDDSMPAETSPRLPRDDAGPELEDHQHRRRGDRDQRRARLAGAVRAPVLAPQRQRVVRGHRIRVEAGVACGRVPRPAGGASISLPTPVAERPMGIPEADELAAQALSALSSSP